MPLFVKNFELAINSGLNMFLFNYPNHILSICPYHDLALAHITALFQTASSFNSLSETISFVKQVSSGFQLERPELISHCLSLHC